MIWLRSFDEARVQKKWITIVDETWLQTYGEEKDKYCMSREYIKADGSKGKIWYRMALKAKIILADDLVISFETEFIENSAVDTVEQKKMNQEQIKQDCEMKAFKRLAKRIKKDFSRLPIVVLCDSLYAGEPVFDICEKNHWSYIIQYKAGSIKSIMEEYEAMPEKGKVRRRNL